MHTWCNAYIVNVICTSFEVFREQRPFWGASDTGLIKHDGNTNNGGRELILNANTTIETKSNYHERGRAVRKMKVRSSFRVKKSASEKEIKRQKNPDAGFKITEQILSICLAHLILCCIEETVMDKVNPASPSGCVLAWTELRTVTHSRETHTHTHTHNSRQYLLRIFSIVRKFPLFSWWGFVWRNTPYQGMACQSEIGRGSGPRRGFESTCARGKLGFLFAQADYECTQLGWVWLNENLFNSAAQNPGLQVKNLCFDLHFAEIWWMPLFFLRVLKSASRLVRLKVARKALSDEWAQMWMSNSMTMIESCQCWERERSSIYPRLPPDCKTTLAEHKRSCLLNSRMDLLYVLGRAVTLR